MKIADIPTRSVTAALLLLCAPFAVSNSYAIHIATARASVSSSSATAQTPPLSRQPALGNGHEGQAGSPAGNQAGTQTNAAASPEQPALHIVDIMVSDVHLFGHESPADKERGSAAIDDIIVVKVEGLQNLVNQSRCVDEANKRAPNCAERPLALFLDGREIKGVSPEAFDVNEGTLHFHLRRSNDNDEAWADLLGAPPPDSTFFMRPTKVSVGLQDGSPVATSVRSFLIVRVDKGWFVAGVIGMVVLFFSLVKLTSKSDLLRAPGPAPVDEDGKPLPKGFSLSRFQMAFWFLLVVAAHSFIWLITGASDISGSVLALIGIGSGTALGAAVVDVSKKQSAPPSEGFLKDILSDSNGICFHRFQMFVWTVVLGIMFVSSVYYDLAMPSFSATMLGLQGISAGTYLGFKIPENEAGQASN